jgi:hypothetical protein
MRAREPGSRRRGLGDLDALRRHPKLGASWEGFVLEQVTGALGLVGRTPRSFFWRTHGGAEVRTSSPAERNGAA